MNDFYTEQLVKKQTDMKDILIKAILVSLTIVSFVVILMYPIGLILPILMIVLDVFQRLHELMAQLVDVLTCNLAFLYKLGQ